MGFGIGDCTALRKQLAIALARSDGMAVDSTSLPNWVHHIRVLCISSSPFFQVRKKEKRRVSEVEEQKQANPRRVTASTRIPDSNWGFPNRVSLKRHSAHNRIRSRRTIDRHHRNETEGAPTAGAIRNISTYQYCYRVHSCKN
ncbi:hypothetical protein NPIL_280851 [Nephila pilipes]|uniref:Uncharacterized protein n=1 Tax=Nephila pilipes TaxID=299642 RepID=A0A8X6JNG0_NEPPI|nr:hypothetical protein NPIL_280851 [Nephila pilipes]